MNNSSAGEQDLITSFYADAGGFAVGALFPVFVKLVPAPSALIQSRIFTYSLIISLLLELFIIGGCVWSVVFESWDTSSPTPLLFQMTPLQAKVLIAVSASFFFDYGVLIHGASYLTWHFYAVHHPLAIIGVAYELRYRVGGALMARLLLDTISFTQYSIPQILKHYGMCPYSVDRAFTIAEDWTFFLLRNVMYTYVSLWCIWTIIANYPSVDLIWSVAVTIWFIIAFIDHTDHFLRNTLPVLQWWRRRILRKLSASLRLVRTKR